MRGRVPAVCLASLPPPAAWTDLPLRTCFRPPTSYLAFPSLPCGRPYRGHPNDHHRDNNNNADNDNNNNNGDNTDNANVNGGGDNGAGIDFLFHMFFLVRYSKALEEGSFRGRPADFLWMLLLGGGLLTAVAPWVNVQFLGSSLTFMMVSRCSFACCLVLGSSLTFMMVR